jgi:hypothetical protein
MQIDFTSFIDRDGYKIVPAKRPPRLDGETMKDWLLRSPSNAEARIVGLGGHKRSLRLGSYPSLFAEFAQIERAEELLAFVSRYGPLDKENGIQRLLDIAKEMKDCLRRGKMPDHQIVDLRAMVSTAGVKMRPTRLIDALWLQLAQGITGGGWRECPQCQKWFSVGGRGGMRVVAKFCSDQCRIDFNSRKRSQGKR